MSKENLKNIANQIATSSSNWLDEFATIAPKLVLERRKQMQGTKCLIQTMISIFIKPNLKKTKNIYIFEGIRNKEYMKAFSADSIVIIGSHLEKKYAETHGYGFAWSFPMVSATHSKISKNWDIQTIRQLKIWVSTLSTFDQVTFFLYEDTQALGCFFVYLGKILQPKVKTVCIQHGYFPKYHYLIRNEGALSDINFVWDKKQEEIIGSNTSSTFEIGLPYIASAKQFDQLHIILTGIGMANDGTDIYEKSIKIYIDIHNMLVDMPNINVFYRPHPNEFHDKKVLAKLRDNFLLIDHLDKVQRLNGPRAIYIGTVSSLLYEAGIAGHLVAHLKLHTNITPVFDFDFDFEKNEINKLLSWILSIKSNNPEPKKQNVNQLCPLERFNLALREAKVIN